MASRVPPTANVLGDFARAHGFSHGMEISWATAVGLLEHMKVARHVDLGERESYLGEHPQLGEIALLVSAISYCWLFSYEDLGAKLRPLLSLV